MLTERLHTSKYSFFDRLLALDYFLIFIVLTIGSVSVFAIHSTESGEFYYYTKNHLIRLVTFFFMFLQQSCSTRPPGGNQVDGLPPAYKYLGAAFLRKELLTEK